MNRLPFFTTFFFLFFYSFSFSQSGYLFIKKGFKKKRTYVEGEMIGVKLRDGSKKQGTITLLKDDFVFINGERISRYYIKEVLLKRIPPTHLPDTKTMLLI